MIFQLESLDLTNAFELSEKTTFEAKTNKK